MKRIFEVEMTAANVRILMDELALEILKESLDRKDKTQIIELLYATMELTGKLTAAMLVLAEDKNRLIKIINTMHKENITHAVKTNILVDKKFKG